MKKIVFILVLMVSLVLVSCTKTQERTYENNISTKKQEPAFSWDNVSFSDQTISYDTKEHILEVKGTNKECEVTITPNEKYIVPGEYEYTASVTYNGETKNYNAKLVIEKFVNVLEIEENQTVYLSDGPARAYYKTNFEGYNPDEIEYFTKPGDYTTTLVFSETEGFSGFATTTVNLHVEYSRSGYYAKDEYDAIVGDDGSKIELYVIDDTKDHTGYTYSVINCDFTKQGINKSNIVVKNQNGDEVESFRTIITVDIPENEEFKAYEQEMFVYFLEGDQIGSNIFLEDYESYGLEHYDAEWYKYEKYTDEEYQSDLEEIERLRSEYNTYKDKSLSYPQQNTLKIIDKNIKLYETLLADKKNVLMKQTYVDQYGGYCADFPTYMEAYSIRRLEDITDIISYIETSYDGFLSYMDYIKDRAEAGYGLSEFTLKSFNEYISGVIEVEEGYYLVNVVKNKISDAKESLDLSDAQVLEYQTAVENAFENKYFAGLKELKSQVSTYITQEKKSGYLKKFKEGYLQRYDGGDTLYESMLRNTLGIYDLKINDYIKFLDAEIAKYSERYFDLYYELAENSTANSIANGKTKIIDQNDAQSLIDFLKEFALTIVPELEDEPTISIIDMDPTTTANTTTLAYYMKSALDSTDKEFIHLNKQLLGSDKLETINTLAHEGYPGHLYAYVYSKESSKISNLVKINTCTGHGEGWAKYVQIALDKYIAEIKDDEDWSLAMEADYTWDLFIYCLYARCDVGINYEGWIPSDLSSYLSKNNLNSGAAKDLYQTLIEVPAQYAPYGYGMATFYNLHEEAKEELGVFYDECKFNNCLLEHGWVPLEMLDGYVDIFMEKQAYLNYQD